MLKNSNKDTRAKSIDVNLMYFFFTLNIFNRMPSTLFTADKTKFSIKDFFSKCDQISPYCDSRVFINPVQVNVPIAYTNF